MSANRDVRRREMPGGRGEDERNMFAAELIAMLNQRGWTQEETAAKMLVSASTVANIKSGGTGEAAGGACARTGMSSANG